MILNPNLKSFWSDDNYVTLRKARYRVLYGGRASSKSHEFATMLVLLMLKSPIKVLCVRAFQNKIDDSVKKLIEEKIHALKLTPYFAIQSTNISSIYGSKALFYGLSRNTGEIKSLEGIDIAWIEEGQFITKDMWDILDPTIRKEGSEIWVTFNPQSRNDFIYQYFIGEDKSNAIVEKINYDRNPFLSKTMRDVIEAYRIDPITKDDYPHVYLGATNDDLENVCISLKILSQSITDIYPKIEAIRIGIDIGDGGTDCSAISIIDKDTKTCFFSTEVRHGRGEQVAIIKELKKWFKGGYKIEIVYDAIGVGAGFKQLLLDNFKGFHFKITPFIASEKPKQPNKRYGDVKNIDYFKNVKIQAWIALRDLLREGKAKFFQFDILDRVFDELSTPLLVEIEDRKVRLETKEELKKRGVASPNLADSVIMAYYDLLPMW